MSEIQCPLANLFFHCLDYTVEGLERKDANSDEVEIPTIAKEAYPIYDAKAKAGKAVHHDMQEQFKVSVSGKRLPIDGSGTWIRRSKNWKPHEVPQEWWRRMPTMHDMWREMFPDPRKVPITDADGDDASIATGADPAPATGVASDAVEGSDGIADGDVSPNVVIDMVPSDRRKLNY